LKVICLYQPLFTQWHSSRTRVRTISVSVSSQYLQYRYRTDTKKVSLPIPGKQGAGRAAVIDWLCIALAVNQPAVNCQTNSMRGQLGKTATDRQQQT